MTLPPPYVLGMAYGLSELGLSIFKRSQDRGRAADEGSLRMLWIVILCSLTAGIATAHLFPGAHIGLADRLYAAGVTFFVGGLILRWYSIFYLGRFFTVDVAIAPDHQLIDSGPYRFIRHPSYAGALMAFLGFAICIGNWVSMLAIMVPITWAFLRRIGIEEPALRAGLGEAYITYSARTKRLIPFVF